MFNAIQNIENSEYARFGKYLHEQHFIAIVFVAFLLHAMGAFIYYILPETEVQEIPVRVLNVKLGGQANASAITSSDIKRLFAKRRLAQKTPAAEVATTTEPTPAKEVVETRPEPEPTKPEPVKQEAKPEPEPKPQPKKVESPKQEVARAALETPKPKAEITPPPPPKPEPVKAVKKETPAKPKPQPKIQKAEPKIERQVIRQPLKTESKKPKRYVRASQLTAKVGSKSSAKLAKNGGSALGNSGSKASEVQKRYTQTISLWIDKHKVYPAAARARGEGGKVILRIRINRQGRILRYLLEQSSGSEAIDRAITQMIDAANPLPAVPADYPDNKPYLEFLIPINFIP